MLESQYVSTCLRASVNRITLVKWLFHFSENVLLLQWNGRFTPMVRFVRGGLFMRTSTGGTCRSLKTVSWCSFFCLTGQRNAFCSTVFLPFGSESGSFWAVCVVWQRHFVLPVFYFPLSSVIGWRTVASRGWWFHPAPHYRFGWSKRCGVPAAFAPSWCWFPYILIR